MEFYVRRVTCFLLSSFLLSSAYSQRAEEIIVIGVTPNGTGLERNKIPFPIQTASAADIENANALSVADFLKQGFASISLNDAQSNPLQPDLQYRGFTASPLLGLAQGIAVYQNNVRINEPLGDTINWDLIPDNAVDSITMSGGANPLFGLNTLGGSLIINMKNGFTYQGSDLEMNAGSFDRYTTTIETGNNNGFFGYYGSFQYFEEDGWREASESDSLNFYGSLSWRTEASSLNLNYQYGDSDLKGNGASPVELLSYDREAIFTGPDITKNDMQMLSMDFQHSFSDTLSFSASVHHRENKTASFNGAGSEFAICEFGGIERLLEGLEEDDLEELGLDNEAVCGSQFANADALEDFLNLTASALNSDDEFELNGFDDDELRGTGILSDEGINNLSDRNQKSSGGDFQWTLSSNLLGRSNQLIAGLSYFVGDSNFNSVLELANMNPLTRLTSGLGTGTFVDEEATSISTETATSSLYFANIMDLTNAVALTVSARVNSTDVELMDRSGNRPELNGDHNYIRTNPAIGLTWQVNESHNLFTTYSESSRAPTPIELACNEGVFDLAVAFAIEKGEDPSEVDLECRLPNAFLADPPLDDVVAKSFEIGARGFLGSINYQAGVFHTTNQDDILFQTTGRSTGLFANVDETQRVGFESSISGQSQTLNWFMAYSYINASFEDNFQVLSPNHAFADDEGKILVSKGDRIPGIPSHQFKLSADYQLNSNLSLGLDLLSNDGQVIRGDESNQLSKVSGYTVVGLRARYSFSDSFEVVAKIENIFDMEYETFGLLGEEPSELEVPIIEDFTISRFLGAGSPRAAFVGFRYRF
jgi:iron complex outermembrane receptor protein